MKRKSKEQPKKTGRPTKRTPELIDHLLLWLADGKTLRAWCREQVIHQSTVYDWIEADEDLSRRVVRAKERGALAIEDEMMEIADTPSTHEDDVQHRKVQLWAREKRLAWNNPAKYGMKTQIGGAADLPPVQLSEDERVARIQQLLAIAKQRAEQEKDNGTDDKRGSE